jgi:hypothetical protein
MNMRGRWLQPGCLAALLLAGCDSGTQPASVTELQAGQSCNVVQGCSGRHESLTVTLAFEAGPRALQPFPVSVQVDADRQPDDVLVVFSMAGMDMGRNRYRLLPAGDGRWRGEVTLPVCSSGRSDWLADVEIHYADRLYRLRAPFVLGQ